MVKKPIISVIVPVFQVEDYLDQCLNSIENQSIENIEIICSYTTSTDKSLAILKEHTKKDNRVKIVYRDDGGLGGARNYGLKFAKGEYVLFVDSDDWLESNMCEVLWNLAIKNSADMVICPFFSENCDTGLHEEDAWGSNLPFPAKYEQKVFSYKDLSEKEIVWENAPVTAWNKLYHMGFIRKNELRFEENCRYEDNAFYYKALILADRISFTQEKLYHYRINRRGSLQNSSSLNQNVFDSIPALYSIKEFLIANKVSLGIVNYATKYILNEFSWRFFYVYGMRRKYLDAVRKCINKTDYVEFIKIITKKSKAEKIVIERYVDYLPKVSIIIPVYNCEKYIGECISSIVKQSINDIEIICVDDASSDHSVEIIREIQKQERRLKLFCLNENRGAGVCRNIALDNAHGEYIFFMDSDDLFPNANVLETIYNAALEHKVYTVAGNIKCFDIGNFEEQYDYSGQKFDSELLMQYKEYVTHPTWGFTRFLYNLECILENKIRFPELCYYEDPCFLVDYMEKHREFWCIPNTVYLYRNDPSHHRQLDSSKIIDLLQAMKKILKKLKQINLDMYYAEYHAFIVFLRDAQFVLNQKKEISAKKKAVKIADEIFVQMEFYEDYPGVNKEEVFRTYEEFEKAKAEITSKFFGEKAKNLLKKNRLSYNFFYCLKDSISKIKISIIKKAKKTVKFLFKPFYQPVRHRYEEPLHYICNVCNSLKEANQEVKQSLLLLERTLHELSLQQEEFMKEIEALKCEKTKHNVELGEIKTFLQESISITTLNLSELKAKQGEITKYIDDLMSEQEKIKTAQEDEEKIATARYDETAKYIEVLMSGQEKIKTAQEDEKKIASIRFDLFGKGTNKRVFLIGTPEHSNLGDAAITLGERTFIGRYYEEYAIVELSTYDFNRWYKDIASEIREDDIIFLQGGGNLGNRFLNEENVRRKVIQDFQSNPIVIFPQTIFFDDSEEGKAELEISRKIYNCHPNLTILLRGNKSFCMAKEYFPNARLICCLDMALILKKDYRFQRKGILLCLRDLNDESGLSRELYDNILSIVEKVDPEYIKTNNLYHNIPTEDIHRDIRWEAVTAELKRFSSVSVVVTDRLHGLIFSMITSTPCVLLSAFNQKIPEFYEMVNGSNGIFFIDYDISKLNGAIEMAYQVDDIKYPEVDEDYYKRIYEQITGEK